MKSLLKCCVPSFAVATLIFASAHSALAAPVVLDRLEASVNSAIVLLSDVDQFRRTVRLRSQLDPIFAGTSVAAKGENASQEEIVDFLIHEKIITQQFPITDTEVEQEINSIQTNNRLDRAGLKKALQEQGFSFDDYFELIRLSASKRNLIDRDIRTKVTVSDDDVKNYYFNRVNPGSSGLRSYQLKLIHVSPKNYKSTDAAREVAESARQAVKSGESFEEVAKRSSDDPSASSGGELGTFSEDQMSPLVREQVRKLRIGEVSEVFGNASSGFYLIKLVDMKTEDTARFDKMKEEIRNQLIASEYQHQISLWLERQRQNAFVHKAGEESLPSLNR